MCKETSTHEEKTIDAPVSDSDAPASSDSDGDNAPPTATDKDVTKQKKSISFAATERTSISTSTHGFRNSSIGVRVSETKFRIRAFLRFLTDLDYTNIQVFTAMRIVTVLVLAWVFLGVESPTSACLQTGSILVGLSDPQGSLGRRLHHMVLTLMSAVFFGTMLPALVWDNTIATVVVAFVLALATGFSPILGSAALFPAMKLGCMIYAINCGISRSIGGFASVGEPMLYTFCGGAASVVGVAIPEIIGNREGMRTQLARVWFGFGMKLGHWGATEVLNSSPSPIVSMAVSRTRAIIDSDATEDPKAKQWLLRVLEHADRIRMASICLSSGYVLTQDCINNTKSGVALPMDEDDVREMFTALRCACRRIAFALQFPWLARYVPLLRRRLDDAEKLVADKAANLKKGPSSSLGWLPAIVDLIHGEVKEMVEMIHDVDSWPAYAPITSVPKRVAAAFPKQMRTPMPDPDYAIRGFALRFAVAYGAASVPGLFVPTGTAAYWFPMTVSLIMNPTEAATYQRVAFRSCGTLLGISLGAALYPLLDYTPALIACLGVSLSTACVVFGANYGIFTFFITGWVCTVTVGIGIPLEDVLMYRVLWTLGAACLVCLATHIFPVGSKYVVTDSIIEMAKAVKAYAEAVVEHPRIMHEKELDLATPEAKEEALNKIYAARAAVIAARVAMLKSINEATLTPTEGYLVDPHCVAPALAGNLIGAGVIPHLVSLVPDACVDDLLADVDETSLAEIDRLIRRLESHVKVDTVPPESTGTASSVNLWVSSSITLSQPGRGNFSHAIALAHRRLDEAKFPPDGIKA